MKHRTDPPPSRQRRRWSLGVLSRPPAERPALDARPTRPSGTRAARHVTTFSCVAEQYRATAVALAARRRDEDLRTVLVTSALNGEGKTLTVLNLAMTLGWGHRAQVLVIDADLRRPAVHHYLDMEVAGGLVDAVEGKQPYAECVRSPKGNTIDVLTAGSTVTNPYPLLASDQFTQLLAWARQRYEWIFIDSPPVLPVADPTILGPRMDGTLLVVALGEYQREVVAHALMLLRQSGTRVTGAVLTKVRQYLPYYLQRYDTYPAYEAYPPYDTPATHNANVQSRSDSDHAC